MKSKNTENNKSKEKKSKIKRNWFYELIRWGALSVFIICVIVICAESAMPGAQSGQQSGDVADVIQGGINDGYDKENLIDINNFNFSIDPYKEYYYVGDSINYEVFYEPENTSYKTLIFESSDESIVSIDEANKKLKCNNPGTATITITSEKKSTLKKSFTIEVREVPVSEILLNETSTTLNINDIYTIETTVLPSNASNKNLTYTSSDESIVFVESTGVITAKKAGSAAILIESVSNPEIKNTFNVTVNESISYDVNMIDHPDVDIYPSQTITTNGLFGPNGASFNFSNLTVEIQDDTESLITITKKTINASSNKFQLSVKCKNDLEITDRDITVNLKYQTETEVIEDSFAIHVHHVEQLQLNQIDESKIVNNYEAKIYNNTYYPTTNNKTSDSVTIKIPYISEVTSAEYKFDKTLFSWEVSSSLTMSSKNYKQAIIKPKNLVECDGWVKYKPFKEQEYTITFNISYSVVEDESKITDITFDKVYTIENDDKVNELFINQDYDALLTNKVIATGGKFNNSFASSGVTLSIAPGSEDKIEFIYDDTTICGLKTLNNVGTAEILAVSTYETTIGYPTPTTRTIKFNITDKPNVSKVIYEENELEDLTTPVVVEKNNSFFLDYKMFNIIELKNGTTFENEIHIPFTSSIADTNILSYNIESRLVSAINGGNSSITLSPEDTTIVGIEKTINVTVDYTPVDKNSIKLEFDLFTNDPYNKPNEDFSKVPVGTQFKIDATCNEDATNRKLGFASSDNEILTVDPETGFVNTLKVGQAKVTVYSIDNPNIYIEKTITVTNTSSPFMISIDDLDDENISEIKGNNDTIVGYKLKLAYGKSYHLRITPLQKSTSTTFKSENKDSSGEATEKIAILDKGGNISLKDIGKTIIKVVYGDNDCLQKYELYLHITIERNTAYTYNQLHTLIRKLFGHFGLFLCTAIPGMIFICMTFRPWWKKLVATAVYAVIGFAVAGGSELIQKFTPGRGPSWKDVGIDFGGFMTTVAVFALVFAIIWLVQYLIQRSKLKKIEERTVKKECKSEGQFAYEQRKLNKQIDRKYNKKKKKK